MVRVNFSKTGWIREILAYGADFKFGPRHVAVTVASGFKLARARGRVVRGPGGVVRCVVMASFPLINPNFVLASLF